MHGHTHTHTHFFSHSALTQTHLCTRCLDFNQHNSKNHKQWCICKQSYTHTHTHTHKC